MKNLAETLNLKTYANNGQYSSESIDNMDPLYEIVLNNGRMEVSRLQINKSDVDKLYDRMQEEMGNYGSIYNMLNLFVCEDDANKVIQYLEDNIGTPSALPHWFGSMEMSPEVSEIFTSFDCYGTWPLESA